MKEYKCLRGFAFDYFGVFPPFFSLITLNLGQGAPPSVSLRLKKNSMTKDRQKLA